MSRPAAAAAGGAAAPPSSIVVRVEDAVFTIPLGVGGGAQTARWLAAAAAARFADASAGGGGVRHREAGGAGAGGAAGPGSGAPRGTVASMTIEWDGAFVGPDVSVSAVGAALSGIGDEAVALGVRVHLAPPHPRGPLAKPPHALAPTTPLWPSLAFAFTKDGRAHAEELLAGHKADMAAARAAAAAAKERETAAAMAKLARLLASDVEDSEAMERNFIFDWANVRPSHLGVDGDGIRRLRRAVWGAYAGICDLFRHFSGGSSKGSTASMQKQEVMHMLVLAGAIDITKERKVFERLFERANAGRGGDKTLADDRDEDSLSRYELLEFLAAFADSKYGAEIDTKSGAPIGIAAAFSRFMADRLNPLLAKLNAGPVRAALKEPAIHKFLLPRLPVLMTVYTAYATADEDGLKPKRPQVDADAVPGVSGGGGGGGGGHHKKGGGGAGAAGGAGAPAAPPAGGPPKKVNLMNLAEFILLLEHAGLLDDVSVMTTSARDGAAAQLKTAKASLTAQEVRETFSGVQRDNDESGITNAEEELTYGEFLEAIGRVAIAKWGDAVGLKYVTDPRQMARSGPNAAAAMSADVFAKAERTLVRALLMWAFSAVEDLANHIGRPVKAPVQYDVHELARLVTVGLPDAAAAAASRGGTGGRSAADILDEHSAKDAAGDSEAAGPGVAVFAAAHPAKPRAPFGSGVKLAVAPVPRHAAALAAAGGH
jgi:hypothetical protein